MNENFIIENGVLKKYTGTEKEVVIPEGIYQISENAFRFNKDVKKIILPSTIKEIGISTFEVCKNLEEIIIKGELYQSELVKLIGFGNINLQKIVGPKILYEDGVVYNEDKTVLKFYTENKSNEYFEIPDSVQVIDSDAFLSNINLKTLKLGKNIEILRTFSINLKSLENIEFNNNLNQLNYHCINCPSIKKIDLSKTKIKTFNSSDINCKCDVFLPNDIKIINMNEETVDAYVSKKHDANIISGIKKGKPTLEELIEKGKTFKEINKYIDKEKIEYEEIELPFR